MACTTSIGPGATNMVTAAALAHVNRLPLLLLPGDSFASRAPDPVLQQLENFADPTITANDCFRSVSRYWDRISRPEQLLVSLPRAIQVLTDPAECGPVTLALPQDVQAQAYDYPLSFFAPCTHRRRRSPPDSGELETVLQLIRQSRRPLLIAGGGVHYADACATLAEFAERHHMPVAETQAGKGALSWQHPSQLGAIGVTGSTAANALAVEADLVLVVGSRLQDFTTASRSLFANPDCRLVGLNIAAFDAAKHGAQMLLADAGCGLEMLSCGLGKWRVPAAWAQKAKEQVEAWNGSVDVATAANDTALPTDAQVLGEVNRSVAKDAIVVSAAGGLPGELHKLWRCNTPGGYHVEYGYSCMGYEIAGGLGVKMACPEREVYVLLGDGSYLMMNSEIATSVMLDKKLIIVLLDNRGFGCINRLQQACGGEPFNNLLPEAGGSVGAAPAVDFAAHARALGAHAEQVEGLAALGQALVRARAASSTYLIVLSTDPQHSTDAGGAWWDVPVPEVSDSESVRLASGDYREAKTRQLTSSGNGDHGQ